MNIPNTYQVILDDHRILVKLWPVYEVKCLCFSGQEWMRQGCHSYKLFDVWILWHEELLRSIWLWYLHWLQNGKSTILGCLVSSCFMNCLKFKILAFWRQGRYHEQIQITSSSYHKNQMLKYSPLEHRQFTS